MGDSSRPAPLPRSQRWAGPFVTVAAILAVEAIRVTFALPYPYPETSLVGTLIVVAAAGFAGGFPSGIASAALVTLYALRFYAGPSEWISLAPSTIFSMTLLGTLAFSSAGVSGWLRRREQGLRDRAVQAERERREALEESRHAISEKNGELERANRALLAVNDGLESFAYVVSHDLKEPVRAMTAYLEDAEERAARPDVRDAIRRAQEANARLARLLNGLLEVSRATRLGTQDLKPLEVLATLRDESTTTRYAEIAAERGARIEVASLLGTPLAFASEDHVSQILGNLVVNAIKHNDKTSPRVRVSVAPLDAEGSMVEVRVEDDGPGFPPRVVEQLSRLKPGRASTVKGGFGLVIVRRAVERMGGNVWATESKELGGSSVHFTLPSALAQATAPSPAADTEASPRQGRAANP